jgi:hypothetical protein
VPLLYLDRLLLDKVPVAVTLKTGRGPSAGGPNTSVYINVALAHEQSLYTQSPQQPPYHEVTGKSSIDARGVLYEDTNPLSQS